MANDRIQIYTKEQIDNLLQQQGLSIQGETRISKDGIITISRGDTLDIPVWLKTGNPLMSYDIQLSEGDVVEFRLFTANEKWENPLLRKECNSDDVIQDGNYVVFNITSEDSLGLDEGVYYYQVKLTYYVNDIQKTTTLIPRRRFYVLN